MKKSFVFTFLIIFFAACSQSTKNILLKKENSKQFVGHVFNTQQKNCLGNGEVVLIIYDNNFYIELNKISYNRKLVTYTREGKIINNKIKTNLNGYQFSGNIEKDKILINYLNYDCKKDTITLKQKLEN